MIGILILCFICMVLYTTLPYMVISWLIGMIWENKLFYFICLMIGLFLIYFLELAFYYVVNKIFNKLGI